MSMNRCVLFLALMGTLLLASNNVEAANRRIWRSRAAGRTSAAPLEYRVPLSPRGDTSAASQHYRALYPKYQTGFHARETQNLGIPTGDIGLRGNGMSWTPW